MPRYKCKNEYCELHGKELARSTVLKVVKGVLIDTGAICPECKKKCESLKEKGMTTNMRGGRNICVK